MAKFTGVTLNKDILTLIDDQTRLLFEDGRLSGIAETPPETVDVKDREGRDQKITKEKEPLYNALIALVNEITFGELDDDRIYEIPGFSMSGKMVPIYIPVAKIEQVARLIDADFGSDKKFEELTGIRLPQQIHQYREDRKSKIGDLPLAAPSPKLKSETTEEYERRLKDHYGDSFTPGTIEVTVGEDIREVRNPYPHERVNYRVGTELESDKLHSEYYVSYYRDMTAPTRRSVRPPVGERITVEESELASEKIPFLQRLKTKGTLVGNAILSGKFWKAVAIGGGTFAAIKWVIIPVMTTPYGVGIATLGAAALLYAGCKAYFKRVKAKKVRRTPPAETEEPERHPVEEEEEPIFEEDDETGTEEEVVLEGSIEEVESSIRGLGASLEADLQAIDLVEQQIENLKRRLAEPTLSDDEKDQIQEQINDLNKKKRELLNNVHTTVFGYYDQFNRGGKSK